MVRFDGEQLTDLGSLMKLEWLETNGLGGYAMGTVAGVNTRRYHGLLCAALDPPVGRRMMLQRLEVSLRVDGGHYPLSTNLYGEVVHPEGYRNLTEFRLDPWPVWTFEAGGVRLQQEVLMNHSHNATIVRFRCLEAEHPFALTARVLLAPRDHHHLCQACVDFEMRLEIVHGEARLRPHQGPAVFLNIVGGDFWPSTDWYYSLTYPEEQRRGLDCVEDLYTPGQVIWSLREGETADLMVSVEEPIPLTVEEAIRRERERRESLVARAGDDEVARVLMRAADQFVVTRPIPLAPLPEGRGEGHSGPEGGPGGLPQAGSRAEGCSIIAGYPWFSDWGRDTMIALPGLLLATGRHEEARQVLRTYAAAMQNGLIPNLFADQGGEAAYNTVDATLWFFVAARRYFDATGDLDLFRDELFQRMNWAITLHVEGTLFGIKMDEDGLLMAGDETTQLTWMDAKVGDWVVTPRHGKAVEINALWYSALRTLEFFGRKLGKDTATLSRVARLVKQNFNSVFWSDELGYLCDCVRGEDKDCSLRPNQVIACALPYSPLSVAQERSILRAVTEKLLTPFGLRTLTPDDHRYRGRYEGDQASRDGAYHQGTVWPWLLGPYLSAYFTLSGRTPEARQWVRELLQPLIDHLGHAGLGTISEVFDGDAPHNPGGCPAQAWSVGEVLRVWTEEMMTVESGK